MRDLVKWGVSERRSCALAGIGRSSFRYQEHPIENARLKAKIKRIAYRHPRYGYRRVWALLRRAGERVNVKRILRLWRKLELRLKRRPSRKRRAGNRLSSPPRALYPRHVVTYDFMFDETSEGVRLKILTVVDEFTREALAIAVGERMTASEVIGVLAKAFERQGWPEYVRSDNGPEFVAKALEDWLGKRGVTTHHIDPGSPWQNAYGESFNDKVRSECLNLELFENVEEARRVLEAWRRHYNTERPHSSLGYRTPEEYRLGGTKNGNEVSFSPAPSALRASRGEGGREGKLLAVGKRRT